MRRAAQPILPLSIVGLIATAWMLSRPGRPIEPVAGGVTQSVIDTARSEPLYVGSNACISCHAVEHDLWTGSHHQMAMAEPTPQTVLADFNDTSFTHFDVTTTFSTRNGEYFVTTDGPDGRMREYKIAYTFGATPLQQYLIRMDRGRLQVLGVCWDSRPADQGGQRWFHIYPDEPVDYTDPLHWTGRYQNWNFMCADCHSTNLDKNYDLASDAFSTKWSEINVSCESCHGPASRHVELANADDFSPDPNGRLGLRTRLSDADGGAWGFDEGTVTATRLVPRASHDQVEACARCHSRRSPIAPDFVHGQPLLDTHRVSLLDEDLYFPDGQIKDEVYVYGSFVQSRMYAAGVTCTDCHEPHALRLRAPGNAVCYTCHLPSTFDTPEHHFHEPDSPGASCVNCHMPTRTYMVVDPRLDHSIRVPRPDLSVALATPNACNLCHADQSPQWAAEAIARWYGPDRRQEPHFGQAIAAARAREPDAHQALANLVLDQQQPAIARATALSLLGDLGRGAPADVINAGVTDADPLVRTASATLLEDAPPDVRFRFLRALLGDPVRAVRIETARVLAPLAAQIPDADARAALDATIAEYIQSQLVSSDRPWAHTNLANLYAQLDRSADAEQSYKTALRLDPAYVQASVNLADLYRATGRDAEGESVLRDALAIQPDQPDARHALGLLLTRTGRREEGVVELARAARLRPQDARLGYVYAVALEAIGRLPDAVTQLNRVLQTHPHDPQALRAMVDYAGKAGDLDAAIDAAAHLARLAPQDPSIARLLYDLMKQRAGSGGG